MKMKTKKKGFTLIELLVCLFIIGLMMLLIIPNIAQQRKTAQDKSDEAIVNVIKTQRQSYMLEHNTKVIPTEDELLKENYINQNQLDAYNKAPEALKKNAE
mgnify:FL=1